jgi:hypothetical protein
MTWQVISRPAHGQIASCMSIDGYAPFSTCISTPWPYLSRERRDPSGDPCNRPHQQRSHSITPSERHRDRHRFLAKEVHRQTTSGWSTKLSLTIFNANPVVIMASAAAISASPPLDHFTNGNGHFKMPPDWDHGPDTYRSLTEPPRALLRAPSSPLARPTVITQLPPDLPSHTISSTDIVASPQTANTPSSPRHDAFDPAHQTQGRNDDQPEASSSRAGRSESVYTNETTSTLISTHLLKHPDHSAGTAIRAMFPNPNPVKRMLRRFEVKHSVIDGLTKKEEAHWESHGPELRRKAGWKLPGEEGDGVVVSKLFWKVSVRTG